MKSIHRRAFVQSSLAALPVISLRSSTLASPSDRIHVAVVRGPRTWTLPDPGVC